MRTSISFNRSESPCSGSPRRHLRQAILPPSISDPYEQATLRFRYFRSEFAINPMYMNPENIWIIVRVQSLGVADSTYLGAMQGLGVISSIQSAYPSRSQLGISKLCGIANYEGVHILPQTPNKRRMVELVSCIHTTIHQICKCVKPLTLIRFKCYCTLSTINNQYTRYGLTPASLFGWV